MHKFLIILMSDDSPSFCHYENKMDSHKLLSLDNLKEAIRFSMKENMSIQIILPKHQLPDEYLEQIPPNTVLIASYDSCYANQADALVFQSVKEFNEYFPDKEQVCVLLLKHYDLDSLLTIKEQNLLGIKGAKINDITKVISHSHALAQCEGYIREHGFEEILAQNTALAAKEVSELNDIHSAAIASKETADLYGLEILEHNINAMHDNTTRFAILRKNYLCL